MVSEDLANGQLVRVLPECSTADSGVEICLFYSHRELLPARLRTFVNFCTEFFRAGQPARAANVMNELDAVSKLNAVNALTSTPVCID